MFDDRAFHEQLLVANMHDDFGLEVGKRREEGLRSVLTTVHLPKLVEGGVDFTSYTVGGDHRHFSLLDDLTAGTLRMMDYAYAEIFEESDAFALALRAADVDRAVMQGKRALFFGIEGALPVREDLALLRTFHRLGLRAICLCWFKANQVGDGVNEGRNGGLTSFGRALVQEMNRLGILVDVSQASERTFWDVLEASEKPVMASHSNVAAVHPHRRNLTDAQLDGLAKNGGVVGIQTFPAHTGPGRRATVAQLLEHIDCAVKRVGADHVGVGLNIITHDREIAERFFSKSAIDFGELWLDGLEDVNKLPEITRGLLERGYSTEVVAKIMGGNFVRVFRQVVG